jgi:hypothetical protein
LDFTGFDDADADRHDGTVRELYPFLAATRDTKDIEKDEVVVKDS